MEPNATACQKICFRAVVARSFASFVHDDIFKLRPHMRISYVKLWPRAARPLELRFHPGSSVEDAAAALDLAPSTLARVHLEGELLHLTGDLPMNMVCTPLGAGALVDAAVVAPESVVDAVALHMSRGFDVAIATVRFAAADPTPPAKAAPRLILRDADGDYALHSESEAAAETARFSAPAEALRIDRGELIRKPFLMAA